MVKARRSTASRAAAWAALAVCVVVWGAALVVPFGSTSSSASSDGTFTTVTRSQTLVASEGARLLVVLAIPIAIAGLAVLSSRIGRVALMIATALMLAWVTVTSFSVGFLYLPAALALCASLVTWQHSPGDFERGARKASYGLLAILVAGVVSWLLGALVRGVAGTPAGSAGLVYAVAGVVVFGFTTATVYTYLAEGGRALRKVLLPARRVAAARESASTR